MQRVLLRAVMAWAAVGVAVWADDWPQWRGPQRNGISQETGLLKEWPAEGPPQIWRVDDIGDGFSTPSVVAGRIYLISNDGLEDEYIQALSIENGRQIWATPLGKVGNPDQFPRYPGSRSTPTVDGEFIYALGSDGDLVCLETATGQVRWRKNLREAFGGKPGTWAYSESPLVDGDVLVCTPGGPEASVVALQKETGDVIWKCAVPDGGEAAYSSPVISTAGGVKQYVQFLAKGLVGIEASTGRLLWQYGNTAKGSAANIPTPIVDGARVYCATGQGGGGLIRLTVNSPQDVSIQEAYASAKLPTAIGGSVKLGEWLYGTGGPSLMCVHFETGRIEWEDRAIGASSVLFADGRLYLHGENGDVALVEPSPEGYREHGRFSPQGQPARGMSKAWAYPVLADGRLLVRDKSVLWCYDVRADRGQQP